jgi:hypothetical protein
MSKQGWKDIEAFKEFIERDHAARTAQSDQTGSIT